MHHIRPLYSRRCRVDRRICKTGPATSTVSMSNKILYCLFRLLDCDTPSLDGADPQLCLSHTLTSRWVLTKTQSYCAARIYRMLPQPSSLLLSVFLNNSAYSDTPLISSQLACDIALHGISISFSSCHVAGRDFQH